MGRSETTPVPGQAEGLLVIEANGRVRSANAEARRALGNQGPVVGVPLSTLLAPLLDEDGHPLSRTELPGLASLSTGESEPWRLVQRQIDDAPEAVGLDEPGLRWLLTAAVPLDGGGEPGAAVSVIDVTGVRGYRTAGSGSPAVLGTDRDGRITDVSFAARELLGYRSIDICGKTWRSFLHAADRARLMHAHTSIIGPQASVAFPLGPTIGPVGSGLDDSHDASVRVRFRHADGEYLWLECRSRVVVDHLGIPAGLRTSVRDCTVEAEMELRHAAAERRLSLTLDHAPIGMALVALDGSFLRVNQALCSIVGYGADDLMGLSFQQITHPDDLDADLSSLAQLVAGDIAEYALDKRYVHRDGRTVWARLSMTLLCDDEDEPLHYISQIEDITERRLVQQHVAESEKRYRLLAENASDIIARCSPEGVILWLSPAVDRILGHGVDLLVGTPIIDLCHPRDRSALVASIREVRSGRMGAVTFRTRHRDGRWIWLESRLHAVMDDVGRVVELQSVSRDVTDRQQARAELERQALTDPLTGLANRALLFNHLQACLDRMRRTGGCVALMLLDLDRFKEINDSLGHPTGDELIRQVAARLRALARPSDTVARLGGDELVLLVDGLPDAPAAQLIADRLLAALREPYQLSGGALSLSVTTSMGIALTDLPDQPLDDLYRQADLALYRAKDGGRDRWAFFEPALELRVRHRLEVHRSLRQAIEAGRLQVLYQPVVNLERGIVEGAEALVRVEEDQGRLLSPDLWLDVAEETGLLGQIDAFVLEAAAAQAARWTGSDGYPTHVAVNVSAGAFVDARYCNALLASMASNGLPPESLRIELTEHSLLQNTSQARRSMQRLAAQGVALGIDDFGTGYSSLSYLDQLPISFVKIDRSFISSLTTDSRRHEVVRAVIDLVHGLGHTVIAEGVETEEQLDALKALNCDFAQGFLFGRPSPAADFAAGFPLAASTPKRRRGSPPPAPGPWIRR